MNAMSQNSSVSSLPLLKKSQTTIVNLLPPKPEKEKSETTKLKKSKVNAVDPKQMSILGFLKNDSTDSLPTKMFSSIAAVNEEDDEMVTLSLEEAIAAKRAKSNYFWIKLILHRPSSKA